MRILVIGLGEVGKAISNVLHETEHEVFGIDKNEKAEGVFDVINICFPYFPNFVEAVKVYQEKYLISGLTIIHSTVPIGTSDKLGAVHSPIRGVHPHLEDGIKTFTKYFGGWRAVEAQEVFSSVILKRVTTTNAKNTEALKLWDTTYYGWNIIFNKAVKEFCNEHGLDFDLVYTEANNDYNAGYKELGRLEVQRPVLKHMEGQIGGHCVISNCHILGGGIAEFILSEDAKYAIHRLIE